MVETKFYCDSCKAEVSSKEVLVDIRLSMKIGERFPTHSIEICNECLTDLGFDYCQDDKKYVKNYSHLVNNMVDIIKKIYKK